MDDDGVLNPEIVEQFSGGVSADELKEDRGKSALVLSVAMKAVLPYSIPFKIHDYSIPELSAWMRDNVHDGWQVSMSRNETCISFARWADALNFKLAFT